MYVTRSSSIKFDIIPRQGSSLICELKLKGSKEIIKVNIDLIIYCKNPIHWHITDVMSSGVQSVYTSKEDSIHIVKLKVPEFKDRVQSYVTVSVDDIRTVSVEHLRIEDEFDIDIRKKKEEEKIIAKINRFKSKMENIKNGGKPEIICEGLMFGHSGLAKAMRNVTFGLDKIGCDIRTIVLDWDTIGFLNTEKGKRLNQLRINSIDIHENPCFWITMNNAMAIGQHDYCYSIAYVMFETENFPLKYAEYLKRQNEIWTPSTFCRDSIIRSGLNRVYVMPLGVDIEQFNPEKVEPMICPDNITGKYKFLSVMGYSERKGVNILIRAFAEEFDGDNNVVLYLKGGWYDHNKARREVDDILKDIKNPPLIYLDFNIYSDNIMTQIYKMCDSFVLPSRGEGWCLPCVESMAMELPTISTRWSAMTDFMNDDNSYLIDIEGVDFERRCDWICTEYVGGRFAIPSKNHLRKLMRHVYEHREDAKQKGKNAREYIVNNFTWEKCCERIYERLKIIAHENS